ncbi:DUF4129 domain-containing protein [uncultured Friedmanniella sp.]|uniref:DUF4129 domain-containing protein n=1 Tax=uncultured Friedmanniella sp. TaxID=335381 RepID=UPI0035CBC4D3
MPAQSPRHRRPDGPSRTLPVAGLVLGVGLVAVLAAGTSSRWSISDRFNLFGTQPSYPPPSQPPLPSVAPGTPAPLRDSGGWLLPALWVLLLVAVVVAAFVVWRLVPRRARKTKGSTVLGAHVLGQPSAEAAPAVQQGLGAAQHLLDTVNDPTDAVLAAWVALEQAAVRSGHPRRPADTPTEFTVEVLSATQADRAAVTTLLALYHRARFSDSGVGPAAVLEARRCLDALARSWSAISVTAPAPAPAPEPTRGGTP